MKYCIVWAGVMGGLLAIACERPEEPVIPEVSAAVVSVEEVAGLLSSLPIGVAQMEEVHDAATASALNGYDEEYRMQDLFACPGQGVGGAGATKAREYDRPLRSLLEEAAFRTKAGDTEAWLDLLSASDVQIYWPFSSDWDGEMLPVITFDPDDEVATRNVGYALNPDGSVQKLMVDEQMARERPVWVVNRNSDAEFKTLEMLRREDPAWGSGGDIVVQTKSSFRTLILKSFKARRHYDNWFRGGAEFWCRIGSVDDIPSGETEAEMRLFNPAITDFMIVVRRNQLNEEIPLNVVMLSEFFDALYSVAFMITEDDGGTITTWKANAVVKYNSKSYGVELDIPLNSRDDIVWRGSLTRNYIERYNGKACSYGDVELVMALM